MSASAIIQVNFNREIDLTSELYYESIDFEWAEFATLVINHFNELYLIR